MWEVVRDWLKLTVCSFEATSIICHAPVNPLVFNIRAMAIPHPSQKMLPWKDAIKKYVPEPKAHLGEAPAARIMEEVEAMVPLTPPDFQKVRRAVTRVKKFGFRPKQIRQVINALEALCDVCCKSPSTAAVMGDIIITINSLPNTDASDRLRGVEEVREWLMSLEESVHFFKDLMVGSVLSTGQGFNGTEHCEALTLCLKHGNPQVLQGANLSEVVTALAVGYFIFRVAYSHLIPYCAED